MIPYANTSKITLFREIRSAPFPKQLITADKISRGWWAKKHFAHPTRANVFTLFREIRSAPFPKQLNNLLCFGNGAERISRNS